MHGFFRVNATSALQRAQFAPEHLPTLAMPPHEAVRQMVRNNVDYVPLEKAFGRIATTLFIYPPGIATIVPGERLDKRARPMLEYLMLFERSSNLFPGFEAEVREFIGRQNQTVRSVSTLTWCASNRVKSNRYNGSVDIEAAR